MSATVRIRITAANATEAEQAIDQLRALCGDDRIALEAPAPGRDDRKDGRPPWFVYGAFRVGASEPPQTSPEAPGATESRIEG